MTKQRVLFGAFYLASGLLILAVLGSTLFQRPERVDLNIALIGVDHLFHFQPLYISTDDHTKSPVATMLFFPSYLMGFHAADRLQDVLNIVLFVLLAAYFTNQIFRDESLKGRVFLGTLTALFLLNQWNTELRLGQYNLVLFCVVVFGGRSRFPAVAGVSFLVACLIKPTFGIFLPWLWRESPAPRKLAQNALIALAVLCAIYIFLFGFVSLVRQTLEWRAFIKEYSGRVDPNLLSLEHFFLLFLDKSQIHWGLIEAIGMGLSVLCCWLLKDEKWGSLAFLTVLFLIFTPLTRSSNYSVLIPFVLWNFRFFQRAESRVAKGIVGLGLGIFYLCLQCYNPTFWPLWRPLLQYGRPVEFWGLFLCVFCTLSALWMERRSRSWWPGQKIAHVY